MTDVTDEIILDFGKIYSKMSLLDLLAEENLMMKFWHDVRLDAARTKLRQILRSEIEKKLQ